MTVSDEAVLSIPGWFSELDMAAFRIVLPASRKTGPGDLAELGVYMGKSAVVVAEDQRPGETFTVVDVFEDAGEESSNRAENDEYYRSLTRRAFESHFLSVHAGLPEIVQGDSWLLGERLPADSHRFVHVDASHLYENVVKDLRAARTILRHDGVLVCDDYRSPHTPGVSAAVWRDEGLRPFLLTPTKLYASYGDVAPYQEAVREWLSRTPGLLHEVQSIDHDVIRVWTEPGAPGLSRFVPPVALPALNRLRGMLR